MAGPGGDEERGEEAVVLLHGGVEPDLGLVHLGQPRQGGVGGVLAGHPIGVELPDARRAHGHARPDQPDQQQVHRLDGCDGAELAGVGQLRQLLGDVGERGQVGLTRLEHAPERGVRLGDEVEGAARRDDPAALHAYGRAQRPGGGVVRDQRGGAARRVLQQHGQRLGVQHQVAGQHGHGAGRRARDLGDAAQVGGQAAGGAQHLDLAHGQRGELVAEAVEQRAVAAVQPARGCRGEQQDRRGRAFAGQ